MSSEMPPADGENREMPLVFTTGRLVRFHHARNKKIPGNFVEAVSFNKDGSLTEYYIRETDYRQFKSQMDSRRATEYESEYHRSAIPQQLVDKAVYKRIYPSPSGLGRINVHWGKLFQFLLYVICIVVVANANLIRDRLIVTICKSSPGNESSVTNQDDGDLLDFLEVVMTNVFEMIYNILYLSYSSTTSLCREILLSVHWMLQSAFHFILWTITASLTFLNDNFPFKIAGFIIFLLTGLGYLPMIYWIKKLFNTEAHLKQVEEKLIFEKKKNCANLNETEKLKLNLKEKDKLYLTLRDNNLNLESENNTLKLKLQEKNKLNKKLELQKKELQLKTEKKTQQNKTLKSENVKSQSEKEEISLKFKEAKKLNVMLEKTGSQLESQNQKVKLELEKVKSQNQELKLGLERERDQRSCVVCTESYRNMLLLPCKHFSLCKTCLNKLKKCPICRKDIESTLDVYTS